MAAKDLTLQAPPSCFRGSAVLDPRLRLRRDRAVTRERAKFADKKIAWNGGASQGQHEQQSPLANSTRATSWLALLLALDASSARLQGESPGAVSVAFGSMAFARRSESTCIKSTRDLPREGPRAAAETRIECRLTCAPYVRNLSAAGGGGLAGCGEGMLTSLFAEAGCDCGAQGLCTRW